MNPAKLLRSLLVLFFAHGVLPIVAQAPASAPAPDFGTIAALGQDLFFQSGSAGMVLVVVRDNQVLFRGYGETAPGSRQVPAQDSLLRLCSLTKIFTDDVLIKLVADHTVELDNPLQRFAPPHLVVPKRIQPITLLDLATHTSGLPRELGSAPSAPHFTFPDYRTRWRWLPNQRLRSIPGTAALYSNIAYDFLSDALQAAAHKQYAALLAERTLNPLHMQSTTFFPNPAQCSRLLAGVHEQGPCATTEATAGSSGLYSTASDMTIWLRYLLGAGSPSMPAPSNSTQPASDASIPAQPPAAQAVYILPAALVSQKGLDHAGQPTGIGLGWIHLLPADSPSNITEKTGGGAGFSTYIAINQARHTAIFLAATEGAVDMHFNLFNGANKLLLAAAGLPPLPPPQPKPLRRVRRRRSIPTARSAASAVPAGNL